MPDSDRPHFFNLDPDELAATLAGWGMPRFRAKQVQEWVYARGVADPEAMTNLSKADRQTLADRMTFLLGHVVRHQVATDGTQKLLVDWEPRGMADGGSRMGDGKPLPLTVLGAPAPDSGGHADRQTECVMIPALNAPGPQSDIRHPPSAIRRTACISSQVGCPVGCRFCASGIGGLDGNLTTGQIVQQVWQLQHILRVPGPGSRVPSRDPGPGPGDSGRITNVVFMGMGEPLSNFDNVTRAVRTLMRPVEQGGMGISGRKITVSTVGLPAQIRRLAELDLPITLAISLHAPNDDIRKTIIPWAEFVTIDQLTDAGRYYFDRTGREVTLEYILLAGVNDQPDHARELARVAKRLRSNVNLIRYNEVVGMPFGRPDDHDVRAFQAILKRANVNTHIRASRGRDIAAACGQLRHESRKKQPA